MAEKFIKIIQDGRPSFIPNTKVNWDFWTKQNSKIAGSQNAQKEMVTIVPATEEENAMLNHVVETPKGSPRVSELDELKAQLAQQQELINKFLLGNVAAIEDADEGEKAKGKPGPKPKTD